MRNFRRLCGAATLLFALSLWTYAGQMGFPVADPQPPPPPSSQLAVAPPSQTDIPANDASLNHVSEDATINPVTEIALSFIQSVLAIF